MEVRTKSSEEIIQKKLEELSRKNRYQEIISVVTQDVHQSIDLQTVLDDSIEAMRKNIDKLDIVSIYLVEEDDIVVKAHKGFTKDYIKRAGRIPYPKGATWKTIIEGKSKYVPDVELDNSLGQAGKDMGFKCYLIVPLFIDNKVVGTVTIVSFEKNVFDDEELKLLEIVSKQISIAIRNANQAELLKESEELLKHNVEILSKKSRYQEIISTVTRSVHQSIELQTVLDNSIDAMRKNIDNLDIVSIYLVEGEEAVLKAHHGFTRDYLKRAGRIPYPKGATWKTIIDGKSIYAPDIEHDKTLGPAGRDMGVKCFLIVPLFIDEKAVGSIGIVSYEKNVFDEEERKLLEIVSKQISIAINNANQAEELKKSEESLKHNVEILSKKSRYEEIMSTVTRSVHSSLELDEVLENAVDAMHGNIDCAENVGIFFVEGDNAVIKANRGYSKELLNKVKKIPRPKGFTWRTILEGKRLYCSDTEADSTIGPAGKKAGTKSYASMPIKLKDKTIACISINSFQKDAFDNGDLKLLDIVAQQIGVAINNATQTEALKDSREELRKSREHFRLLVETTNVIPWEADAKTFQFTYVGPQAEKLLGYPVQKWYEEGFWLSCIYEDDRHDTVKACISATAASKDHELEYRMVTEKGDVRWIYEMVSVISENGEAKTLRGFLIDVTEREQAHSLLLSEKNILEMISQGKELTEILDYICLAVEKQTDRMLCSFLLADDTGKALVSGAAPNLPEDYVKAIDGVPIAYGIGSCGTASYLKERVIVSNISTDPLWADFSDLALKHNLQACWSTPILSNSGDLLGTFAAYYSEPREPIQREFDIIERATNLARIAIERKKAEDALNENLDRLYKKSRYEEIISTVTRAVHQSLDLDVVIENAIEAMSGKIDNLDISAIYMVEGKEAVLKTHRGHSKEFIKRAGKIPYPKGATWKTIIDGKSTYIPDVDNSAALGEAGRKAGMKSYLATPLFSAGKVVGAIFMISYKKNAFDEEELKLLEIVSHQVEIAINQSRDAEALSNSEERYRTLYQEGPSMYFTVNEDGNVLSVNHNGIEKLGYAEEELIGHSVYSVFLEEDKAKIKEQLNKCFANPGQIFRWELRKVCKNGSLIPVSELARCVIDPGGNKVALIACEDITERMESEKKLQKAFTEIELLKDKLEKENVYLKKEIELTYSHSEIIGQSKAIKGALRKIEQVAATDSTVILTGETGTGKERFADRIHSLSRHKDRIMVKVNCAALPPHLIESELFGHEKGSFTGAVTKNIGRFELADGSTIFLDEIGEFPLELQSKLLRVLQEGEFQRVGSSKTTKVNVRVIAATNNDLLGEVSEGRFREDLYYRLNVFPINIPPLRQRKEDITDLLWFFISEFEEKMGKTIKNISRKDMENLIKHPWPGNVRQLRNVIERAMIISTGPDLEIELPGIRNGTPLDIKPITEVEKDHIAYILNMTNWRIRGKSGAAEVLGLKPTTLESRIKKLGIKRSH